MKARGAAERLLGFLFAVLVTAACAERPRSGETGSGITIAHAYAPAQPLADVAALYFTVRNDGRESDTLLAVSVVGTRTAELHRLVTAEGRMQMQEIDRAVVPARGSLRLAPGGYHVMLFGLDRHPEVGDRWAAEATFARQGTVPFTALVLPRSEVVKRLQQDPRRR